MGKIQVGTVWARSKRTNENRSSGLKNSDDTISGILSPFFRFATVIALVYPLAAKYNPFLDFQNLKTWKQAKVALEFDVYTVAF